MNDESTTARIYWILECFENSKTTGTLSEQKPSMEPSSGRTGKTYVPTPCTWTLFAMSNGPARNTPGISAPGLSFRYDEFADAQAICKARPRCGKKSIDVERRFRRIGQPAAYKFRRR